MQFTSFRIRNWEARGMFFRLQEYLDGHKPFRYNQDMKTLGEIQQILREQKPYLAAQYGVRIVGVFGSYVRQEQRPGSDLDLLIELDRPPRISLIGLVELDFVEDILDWLNKAETLLS
jgi:predicted nucleotidyltransferase